MIWTTATIPLRSLEAWGEVQDESLPPDEVRLSL